MNLNIYPNDDHRDIQTFELRTANADTAFRMWCQVILNPFCRTSRVTLTDPMAGGRIVRDTDREVFGFGDTHLPGDQSPARKAWKAGAA